MKIFLHEISDESTDLHFTSADSWVYQTVTQIDEASSQPQKVKSPFAPQTPAILKTASKSKSGSQNKSDAPPPITDRDIQADFSLRKVDEVLLVDGKIHAPVQLLCSRCATPFFHDLDPVFQMLYTKDPQMAGVDRQGSHARHAHDEDERNIDISHLSKEYIDLSEILSEQLYLVVPVQPLCKVECKGICGNCGADLNKGRCPCGKLATLKPFAALKDIKPKVTS